MIVIEEQIVEQSLARLKTLVERASQWGVWCVQDCCWCDGTIGTHAHALAELPRWRSGEAAEVDPSRFTYEVRRLSSDMTQEFLVRALEFDVPPVLALLESARAFQVGNLTVKFVPPNWFVLDDEDHWIGKKMHSDRHAALEEARRLYAARGT